MKTHFTIRVQGRVQGVFFRHETKREAEELGLTGLAWNEADGSLAIEAEGDRAALEKFLKWCRKGPPGAEVKEVTAEERPPRHFARFTIER